MNIRGVSAIMGVIIMVAITVAIATVVLVYVNQLNEVTVLQGELKEFSHIEVNKYKLVLGNHTKTVLVGSNDPAYLKIGNYYIITLDWRDYIQTVVEIDENI
jgi:hypothetical protein